MTKPRLIYFLIVVIFSFSAIFFLSTPIILFIAKLPFFQQVYFFPGYAESFAAIPVLALIYLFVSAITKITLKEWKYVAVAVFIMVLTNTTIIMINRYQTNKFSQGLSNELNQAIQQSRQAQIIITDFEEIPVLDSSQNLEKITFKIRFISNITANMNINSNIQFVITK